MMTRDQFAREVKKLNQYRFQVTLKIQEKEAELAESYSQLMTSYDESELYRQIIDDKRKEIGPLHQTLGKLRNSNTGGGEKSLICSSEEVLNDVIKILAYRTQDESIPLSEKQQIFREIKQLEGTRDKVIANSVEREKIEQSLGEKEAIQDQVLKEKEVVEAKLDKFDKEKKAIEKAIKALEDEEKTISADMQKIGEKSRELRRQIDKGARKFAASKNIEGLRDLASTEVETFMSLCSSNKAFRDDYERRILHSLWN